MSTPENYEARLQEERAEKDEFLADHPRSPIPAGDREGFDGLEYFPPDPAYRFELPLQEHDDAERITVETTQDGSQTYRRVGAFRFEVDGETVVLQAYRSDPEEARLWVPFRDATNGEETYPAGRYLDLEAEDRTDVGDWVLDLNRAYSPFCAYSEAYECPLIPTENWLDVRIEAGEKAYES
ncbi:MAG: DUF1684 domain-containing protein [Halobacteriales archaeon]